MTDSLFSPEWFCPLIKRNCTRACVCYEKPELANTYAFWGGIAKLSKNDIKYMSKNVSEKYPDFNDSWYVAGNRCDNAMFRGNK